MLNPKKVYKLDFSKWRCGNYYTWPYRLGKGPTFLLNKQGFMCCLGQFSEQEGIARSVLLGRVTPRSIPKEEIPAESLRQSVLFAGNSIYDHLLRKAVNINDDKEIKNIAGKFLALRKLFISHGCDIEIANNPFDGLERL